MMDLTRSFLVALALLAAGGSAFAADQMQNRDIANGEVLYQENCAACHGARLEGQANWQTRNADGTMPAPPHDESGHTWHHDNQLLFDYTALGGQGALAARGITDFQSAMPGFAETLTEEEIWEVLAFIRSTWPERVQRAQDARNPPHD